MMMRIFRSKHGGMALIPIENIDGRKAKKSPVECFGRGRYFRRNAYEALNRVKEITPWLP